MANRDDLINACVSVVPGANRTIQTAYVRALMDLCDRVDPECVVDIGTNHGASCLALASAMRLQHKDTSRVTTIDIHRGLWMTTMSNTDKSFAGLGMNIRKINAVESDFKQLDAADYVKRKRMMVFYDIHNGEDGSGVPNSAGFIKDWLPLINKGVVAVHDITPCAEDWEWPDHWKAPPSLAKVQSIGGQWFRGFGEAGTFIDLLNQHKVEPHVMPRTSIIWFEVENGRPK